MGSGSDAAIPKILVAIKDQDARRRVETLLEDSQVGLEVIDPEVDPLERAPETTADLMIVRRSRVRSADLSLVDGYTREQGTPRLVVLRDDDGDDRGGDRVRLLAAGAARVLEAGDSNTHLRAGLEATAAIGLRARGEARRGEPAPRLSDFLSRSPSMRRFLDLVRRVVASDSSLLITGETGVGKERLAQAIHNEGPRRNGPFVSVNCGALPEQLLASELFGHEAGAFTGATRRKKGRFELAHGGTIFLDEIGEMPLHLQVNLLSVLQRHAVHRVGGEETVPVDVRVMAATNRDVVEDVRRGRFREDLYFRLNVVNLRIPPLRERREDIPDLVGVHMREFRSGRSHGRVETISDAALDALLRYPWPGNVRELVNAVEHAMVLCESSQISVADLPEAIAGAPPAASDRQALPAGALPALPRAWLDLPLREARQAANVRLEREYLDALLARTDGKIGETARRAGITPRSLYGKMKRLGLRKEDYR